MEGKLRATTELGRCLAKGASFTAAMAVVALIVLISVEAANPYGYGSIVATIAIAPLSPGFFGAMALLPGIDGPTGRTIARAAIALALDTLIYAAVAYALRRLWRREGH